MSSDLEKKKRFQIMNYWYVPSVTKILFLLTL